MRKFMLAEAAMSRLASLLGMPSWLEVTVEEDGALDNFDFKTQTQAGGVIATFDLSANHLAHVATDHWLSNSKNVIALRLTEPAWVHSQVLVGHAPASSHAEIMSEWGVGEVARWLQDADMEGSAAIFQAEGVNGKDVIAFASAESGSADLRLSPFAARKMWGYRAAFFAADASA